MGARKWLTGPELGVCAVHGFYEWQDMGNGQRRHSISITVGEPQPIALAGLLEAWACPAANASDQQAPAVSTAAALTTAACGRA